MVKLRRIVVPIDFSKHATKAAEYAAAIARHYEAELTVLHVVESPSSDVPMLEPSGSRIEEIVGERVSKRSAELDTFIANHPMQGVNATREALHGEPAEAIVRYCEKHSVDLVVMPTHGDGPVRHFLLGSVSAKVLHDIPCAVISGIHSDGEFGFPQLAVRRVLVAVDLGPRSAPVLQWGFGIANEFQAEFHVVHVLPRGSETHRSNGLTHTRGARIALEELLSAGPRSLSVRTVIRSGEPQEEIARAASSLQADLLIIGRGTSHGAFGRLRTQSYGIVRQSPCPVLSV